MLTSLGNLLNIGLDIKDGLQTALEEFITANAHLKKFSKDKMKINITDNDSVIISLQREKGSSIIDDVVIFSYDEEYRQLTGNVTPKYLSSNITIASTLDAMNTNLCSSISFLRKLSHQEKTNSTKVAIGFHLETNDSNNK